MERGRCAGRRRGPEPSREGEVEKLAPRYASDAPGENAVTKGEKALFDFGEFKSEVASRRNPDGTVSFLTTIPGFDGLEFVVGEGEGKRTLVFRDAQHEYKFTERELFSRPPDEVSPARR
jgi:hypothetical protein